MDNCIYCGKPDPTIPVIRTHSCYIIVASIFADEPENRDHVVAKVNEMIGIKGMSIWNGKIHESCLLECAKRR